MPVEYGIYAEFRQSQPIRMDVRLQCSKGELLCLAGPSGSGKSTTLRLLAGLDDAEQGIVRCNGQTWYDSESGKDVPTHERHLGMVFQSYGLFPHLDVARHIEIGLSGSGLAQPGGVDTILELVNLSGFERRKPVELSGGQQQRLALARALARQPDVLLLDEPFSAVDLITRRKLRRELVRIRASLNIPIILVTHDLDEAFQLADQLCVIHQGKTLQCAAPGEIMDRPDSAEIARLMGITNIFEGTVLEHDAETSTTKIKWLDYLLECRLNTSLRVGEQIRWIVPKNRIILHQRVRPSRGQAENPIEGTITEFNKLGDVIEIDMLPDGSSEHSLSFSLPLHVAERNQLSVGERIGVSLSAEGIHTMPESGERQ